MMQIIAFFIAISLSLFSSLFIAMMVVPEPATECQTNTSPWLSDETGMKIAPRITLEPKP